MNVLTVLLVISVCCTVGYCRAMRTRRFVPYFAAGYDMPDAMQDYIRNHYYMTGTLPAWAMPRWSPYYNAMRYNPYQYAYQPQGQFQGQVQGQRQPATGTTYQPNPTTQRRQQVTTVRGARLVPGQPFYDPVHGSGTVATVDGTDGNVVAADGSIISVDGTDRSRDSPW